VAIDLDVLRSGLAELASKDVQRREWVRRGDRHAFVDATARVFERSGLSVALGTGEAEDACGLEAEALLRELKDEVRHVDTTHDAADMVENPPMQQVRRLTTAALDALEAAASSS